MYLDYWGFHSSPFGNAPNRDLFYTSPQHEEALLRLLYAVENRKGAALLSGEVGSGKTTVSQVLMNRLPKDRFEVKTIVNPALNPLDFIQAVLGALGHSSDSTSKSKIFNAIQAHLVQNAEQDMHTILIIDEAHMIDNPACLEELRMMLNLQQNNEFLVTLIILGQPPLLAKVNALDPLKERIAIKYHLEPLDLRNMLLYILFRLKSAGATRGIFTKQTLEPIREFTRGLPLRINNLCDRCLLVGMMRQARFIGPKIVSDAIEDLS